MGHSRRLSLGHALASLLVMVGLFVLPGTALAQVPPAGNLFHELFPVDSQCEVKVTLDVVKPTYQAGDLVSINLTLFRTKGSAGKIRVTVPLDTNYFDPPSAGTGTGLDPGSVGLVTLEGNQSRLTYRTATALTFGQSLSFSLNYRLSNPLPNGPLGTIIFTTGQVYSLDSNNNAIACDQINDSDSFTINPPSTFDLQPLASGPDVVTLGQTFALQARFRNNSGTVPKGTTVDVSFAYPSAQVNFSNMTTGSPSCIHAVLQFTVSCPVAVTTPMGSNVTFRTNLDQQFFLPNFIVTGYPPGGTINITVCAKATGISVPYEQNTANDCLNLPILVVPLTVTKTWADGTSDRKTDILGGTQLAFKVSVTNWTTSTLNAGQITMQDHLLENENCNTLLNPLSACLAWDATGSWVTPLPAGFNSNPSGSQLTWDPGQLTAGQTKTYDLVLQIASQATLDAAQANGKTHARCNTAKGTFNPTVAYMADVLCWNYKVPPGQASDPVVSKSFRVNNQLVNTATYKQGEVGEYAITITNQGAVATSQLQMDDQLTERTDHTGQAHFVAWDPASLSGGLTGDDTFHTLTLPPGTQELNPSQSLAFSPKFAIACDAYDRASAAIDFDNVAEVNAANDTDRTNNKSQTAPPLRATIIGGHYKLDGFASFSPAQVVPGSANDTTTLTITLTNQDDQQPVDQDIKQVTVTVDKMTEFTPVSDPSNSAYTTDATGNIIFNAVDVPANGNQTLRLKYQVGSLELSNNVVAHTKAEALSKGQSCGTVAFDSGVGIVGPDFALSKSVLSPANTDGIGLGDTATYELRITNLPTYNIPTPLEMIDPLDPMLEFAGFATCDPIAFCNIQPDKGSGNGIPHHDPVTNTVSASMNSLPAGMIVTYSFKVRARTDLDLLACPTRVFNSPDTTEDRYAKVTYQQDKSKKFGATPLDIYADRCLTGNIYARNPNTVTGGVVFNSNLVVDPNSIISARGSIVCNTNKTCDSAPFKIGNYSTTSVASIGLDWDTIVLRMQRNIDRLTKNTTAPVHTGNLSGSFNLYGAAINDSAKNPEGKVWIQGCNPSCDLTVDVTNLSLSGLGTFIVRGGNLTITGTGGLDMGTTGKRGIGFIVLPDGAGNGGNVTIASGVTKLRGVAIYAPGSSPQPVTPNGIIFIDNTGLPLRPAKGLFIARQFNLPPTRKAAFEYDASLNSGTNVPPGFTFTVSPTDVQEGS